MNRFGELMKRAYEAGCTHVRFDVQLTAECTPTNADWMCTGSGRIGRGPNGQDAFLRLVERLEGIES